MKRPHPSFITSICIDENIQPNDFACFSKSHARMQHEITPIGIRTAGLHGSSTLNQWWHKITVYTEQLTVHFLHWLQVLTQQKSPQNTNINREREVKHALSLTMDLKDRANCGIVHCNTELYQK